MATSDDQDWHAAMTAWNGLDAWEQSYAIGYIASQHAEMVTSAVQSAARQDYPEHSGQAGRANAAVSGLNTREMRDVLYYLAATRPGLTLGAIREASGA